MSTHNDDWTQVREPVPPQKPPQRRATLRHPLYEVATAQEAIARAKAATAHLRAIKPPLPKSPEGFWQTKATLTVSSELPPEKAVLVSELIEAATKRFSVGRNELISERRSLHLVRIRQAIMWLAHKYTKLSYPQIGKRLGGRNHTTILHGVRQVAANPERFAEIIEAIKRERNL